ncbi:S41 family peptidase [Sphingomonas profundi]|uniref:S41 family peptidase n=1 Tax=Alterirhizorhabdus profundi TaxID=2681549 RepID=UPI0012E874B8|nr:S41 family peptidase [Sphingomonas profundi]
MTCRLLLLALALSAAPAVAAPSAAQQARNLRVYDKAWSLVGRRYWDRSMRGLDWPAERARLRPQARDAESPRALYAAINALLERLGDSHVYALSPERAGYDRERARGDGESGFGFDAYQANGAWWIRQVQAGGPAAAAGMQIGWKLVSVNGRPVDVDDHFGEGDGAALVLQDEGGATHAMTLRGAPLPPEPSRRTRRLEGGVLLLAFDQFVGGDDRWIARELAGAPRPRAVILDLRENEGGEADVLDRVAGLFVDRRSVVLRLTARRTRDETTAGAGARAWLGPLAILVGPRTASAGEALAAFLGESGRATTVGERTAGALTAGATYRLPDGGRLTVAEHDIRTPGGARLEGAGYLPGIVVVPTLAQLRRGADPALDRAVAAVTNDYPAGASASMSPPSVR